MEGKYNLVLVFNVSTIVNSNLALISDVRQAVAWILNGFIIKNRLKSRSLK